MLKKEIKFDDLCSSENQILFITASQSIMGIPKSTLYIDGVAWLIIRDASVGTIENLHTSTSAVKAKELWLCTSHILSIVIP